MASSARFGAILSNSSFLSSSKDDNLAVCTYYEKHINYIV